MRVWITTVGWSPFAVINPLWAACFLESEQFIPEIIVVLNNGSINPLIKENLKIVEEWIIRILKQYDVEEPIIESPEANEDDLNRFTDIFRVQYKKYKNEEVAIDMTPGRKFMSSVAMNIAVKYKVRKLYYLQLWGRHYQNLPFIKIPLIHQKLINIMEYV